MQLKLGLNCFLFLNILVVIRKFGCGKRTTEVFILAPSSGRPVLIERYSGKHSNIPFSFN